MLQKISGNNSDTGQLNNRSDGQNGLFDSRSSLINGLNQSSILNEKDTAL